MAAKLFCPACRFPLAQVECPHYAVDMTRKYRSPAQERGLCPKCGGKTLGNIYTACFHAEPAYAYRQCHNHGCSHIERLNGVAPQPVIAPKPDFPRNKQERALYEHYLSGVTGGSLYQFVSLGMSDGSAPDRSNWQAYAAYMAGKALTK
jgi:hypothetical protein